MWDHGYWIALDHGWICVWILEEFRWFWMNMVDDAVASARHNGDWRDRWLSDGGEPGLLSNNCVHVNVFGYNGFDQVDPWHTVLHKTCVLSIVKFILSNTWQPSEYLFTQGFVALGLWEENRWSSSPHRTWQTIITITGPLSPLKTSPSTSKSRSSSPHRTWPPSPPS